MPFSTRAKKMNMMLQSNSTPLYYNTSLISAGNVNSATNMGVLNGVGLGSVGGYNRVFSQGSMIDKISNIKNSGCSSCGR
jgi:hypothetical protein